MQLGCGEDDKALREAFARGEEPAFDETLRLYGETVERLARRLMGWQGGEEVDDAVQEVFVRAYLKRKTFRGESSLKTWLIRVTVNTCRSMQRKRLVRMAYLREWIGRFVEGKRDRDLERGEAAERVRVAVRKLGGREREVVVLHYLEEIPVREVAEVLGISEGAVHMRLFRGREKLKEMLEGEQ